MSSGAKRRASALLRRGARDESPATAAATALRSVSGFEIYRKVYRDVIKPERVAELLILRSELPRSTTTSTRVSSVTSDSSPRSTRPTACPMVSPSTPTVACGCACSVGPDSQVPA